MSSRPPTSAETHEAGLFYPTRVGPRYGMMEEGRTPRSISNTLPPPSVLSGSRPHLPPPSHLEPSFIPQSPQGRPQYLDLPTRTPNHTNSRRSNYEQVASQDYSATTHTSPLSSRSPYGSGFPHPPLYRQKVSYQSNNPGTMYEALSPIDYSTHGLPPEPSLFNEGGYTSTSPYPNASLQQHQSPASSYRSSGTSSSGMGPGSAQLNRLTSNLEPNVQKTKM